MIMLNILSYNGIFVNGTPVETGRVSTTPGAPTCVSRPGALNIPRPAASTAQASQPPHLGENTATIKAKMSKDAHAICWWIRWGS